MGSQMTRSEILVPVVAAMAAVVGGVVVATGNWLVTNREMNVKMVEIAVGILSQEPKDNIASAREWAADVIDHYSDVDLSPSARTALVNNRAVSVVCGNWDSCGFWDKSMSIDEVLKATRGPTPDKEVIIPPSP